MTDSKDKKEELSVQEDNQAKIAAIAAPKNKGSANLLLNIIAILALCLTAIAIYATMNIRQDVLTRVQALLSEVEVLKSQQVNAALQVDAVIKSVDSSEAKLSILDKGMQEALQQREYQSNDWLLLKTRYYLELAQVNAHWSDNLEPTSALLGQANELLNNINEPQILPIRQAIAKEIESVDAINTLDVVKLLSQLDALQVSVSSLEVKQPTFVTKEKTAAEDKPQSTSKWRHSLNESVNMLGKLIVIRRNNEIQPLISPSHESLLRESIRLKLQEAQWAILKRNEKLYLLTLKQAQDILQRAFAEASKNTQAMRGNLLELEQVSLTQKKPDLGQALSLINQLIASKKLKVSALKASATGAKV